LLIEPASIRAIRAHRGEPTVPPPLAAGTARFRHGSPSVARKRPYAGKVASGSAGP
jgi:hypothetical protein